MADRTTAMTDLHAALKSSRAERESCAAEVDALEFSFEFSLPEDRSCRTRSMCWNGGKQ